MSQLFLNSDKLSANTEGSCNPIGDTQQTVRPSNSDNRDGCHIGRDLDKAMFAGSVQNSVDDELDLVDSSSFIDEAIDTQRTTAFATVATDALPSAETTMSRLIGGLFIYLLPDLDRTHVKIGMSTDPWGRISGFLPNHPEIDLSRSVVIEVDTLRIERVLHIVFSNLRKPLPVKSDGSTEWFKGDLVDEIIDLCHQLAFHRSTTYTVIRNIEPLIQSYRQNNPLAGTRIPRLSLAERQARLPMILDCLTEEATEQAMAFIESLAERELDEIVFRSGHYYLVRTVEHAKEPECWAPENCSRSSAWGRHLAVASEISASLDGTSAKFHLLNPPVFEQLNDQQGRESFKITEGPNGAAAGLYGDATVVIDRAFEILWQALASLAIRACPDLSMGGSDLPTSSVN